jgi:hypothetical protein
MGLPSQLKYLNIEESDLQEGLGVDERKILKLVFINGCQYEELDLI